MPAATPGYAGMPDACACSTGDRDTDRDERLEKDEARITLSEEEVKIGKRQVEADGIRLRKIIRTETVNQPVELSREEIVIERVPTKDRPISRTDVVFREEEIYIPLRREETVGRRPLTRAKKFAWARSGKRNAGKSPKPCDARMWMFSDRTRRARAIRKSARNIGR